MASSEILSQTLSSITSIKLDQLNKQKDEYEGKKRALLDQAGLEADARKRAMILLDGSKKLPSMKTHASFSALDVKQFIEQAQYDPCVSSQFLQDYETALRNGLKVQSNRYAYASLCGQLVKERISAGKNDEAESPDSFVSVGREEMHEQRAIWEEYILKPRETDGAAIKAYLDDVFKTTPESRVALGNLLKSVKNFQDRWINETHFDTEGLTKCITGMLQGDVLSDRQQSTLRDFLGNKVVLSEIADVLNMRMSALGSWDWDEPVVIQQRRKLNGRYRFYPEEDILHSLFTYYIGQRWCVFLGTTLREFVKYPEVWKPDTQAISKRDAERRRYFVNSTPRRSRTVAGDRDKYYWDKIFLDHLPKSVEEKRARYGSDARADPKDTRPSYLSTAQGLLHRLQAEILTQTKLGSEVTVIRTDFKWFGPSLPHSSLYAVLEYFGVSAEWIDFFRRVLEAPLRFEQDPPDAAPRVRVRGTPIGTPLADFLGELLLFCLDFAVNQQADGVKLYRLHDDSWAWGSLDACTKAWAAMTQFARVVGLDFNESKTGCVRILRDGAAAARVPSNLPQGDVTWGLLKLDPVAGRFVINQAEVDAHIEELRLQLGACRSIFDWTQAWNMYAVRFFTDNFGSPADCYGRDHVDAMLATFQRIQQRLFPDSPGGVGQYLKHIISERFGVSDLPDGYLYYPVSFGGLGLQNPFVNLYQIRTGVVEDPDTILDDFLGQEAALYRRYKRAFDEHGSPAVKANPRGPGFKDMEGEPFMSFEEYTRNRDCSSELLVPSVTKLQRQPTPQVIKLSEAVMAAMGRDSHWGDSLSSYDKWIIQLFHKDMIEKFGGLHIVDQDLLPMGLIGMLQQSRFQWQG